MTALGSRSDSLKTLDADLLSAHERNDKSGLVALYKLAGETREREGDIDAACFYYTHAYVFALETGDREAGLLLGRLVRYGRDEFPPNSN